MGYPAHAPAAGYPVQSGYGSHAGKGYPAKPYHGAAMHPAGMASHGVTVVTVGKFIIINFVQLTWIILRSDKGRLLYLIK